MGFDLADHNIKMTFLVLRPAPNMSTVDEDGERMRFLAFAYGRSLIGDDLGDFAETISGGGGVLPGTGQEGLQYPSRLPK